MEGCWGQVLNPGIADWCSMRCPGAGNGDRLYGIRRTLNSRAEVRRSRATKRPAQSQRTCF